MAFNAVFLSNGDLTFQKLEVSGSKGIVALADVRRLLHPLTTFPYNNDYFLTHFSYPKS